MTRKSTVLIVDDDNVSLSLLGKLVEKLSYQVISASDGTQALEVLKSNQVDLIISDYEMPELDGLELLKIAKGTYPRLPFILVTAFSNLRVIREAWEFGAFDFFQKPVFVDRLNQTIRLAVDFGDVSISRRAFPRSEDSQVDPGLLNISVIRELAVALEREDLRNIAEEFETHARIELEQILRFSLGRQSEQVRTIAHRLAGTSVNLGVVRIAEEMRAIEAKPSAPIRNGVELGDLLERSIHWLQIHLAEIYRDIAI